VLLSSTRSMTKPTRGGNYPPTIEGFHNLHAGETCVIICNGPGQLDIPDSFLNQHVTFGSNTLFEREGFTPTYYCAVDSRIVREDWLREGVEKAYSDIPKFVPTPNLDHWQGPLFYRFRHRPGPLWPRTDKPLYTRDFLNDDGIQFNCVTHVLMQMAIFMGFDTLLCVGIYHKNPSLHFWGNDENAGGIPNLDDWASGYFEIAKGFEYDRGGQIINISSETYLPEDVLRRGNWKDYEL